MIDGSKLLIAYFCLRINNSRSFQHLNKQHQSKFNEECEFLNLLDQLNLSIIKVLSQRELVFNEFSVDNLFITFPLMGHFGLDNTFQIN